MKLIYNGVDFCRLADHVRVLQHTTQREPAEAPQREKVTLRVRLDFFEQSYRDNYSLIVQARAALKTQQATLLWQDDSPSGGAPTFLERTVTAGDDDSPEEANAKGGTYWQSLVLSFWYYNHDVVTNCLKASVGQSVGQSLDLGAVEKWSERLNVTRFDELRDPRQRVAGQVTCSGKYQGDTTVDLNTRRTALVAQKDALKASLMAQASVLLAYGGFKQTVRVVDFSADLDQPNNQIGWSLTCTYIVYPNEANYLLCDYQVTTRESRAEGIVRLTVAGKIGAASESAARAKLALLKGSLVPIGYACLNEDSVARSVESRSGSSNNQAPSTGDGLAFLELTFTLEYRDAGSLACTFQKDGVNQPSLNLGTVDRFADRYATTLFDEMRDQRRRTAGAVTLTGHWFAPETLSDAGKQAALIAQKVALDAAMARGIVGRLRYQPAGGTPAPLPVFNQVVRVLDFSCELNRLRSSLEWSVSASFTRFPNESDYALCDFQLSPRENKADGTVLLGLHGRIGAPTPEAARSKLAALRTQLIPAGYVMLQDHTDEHRVDTDTPSGGAPGDGATFIELSFADEYQKAAGNVLSWTLRVSEDDDVKTTMVRTVYAGSVLATGADAAGAYAVAAAQAATLGAGKLPFAVRSQVTETTHQVLTSGGVLVGVEFSYEYQGKGTMIFLEVASELTTETFGLSTETVSGTVTAPTLSDAKAAYAASVRGLASYAGALLLNERTPTLARQRLADGSNTELATLDDRFTFSFQVLRPKTVTSLSYTLEPASNFQTLELTTTVRGTVRAADEATAQAFLTTFLSGLAPSGGALGKLVKSSRPVEYQQAPAVGGAAVKAFVALHFTEEYVGLLTGLAGVLECEVTEDVQYSGNRIVEKPIPDGLSILQNCGTKAGSRTVSARAAATTETAARAWVLGMRTQLLTGTGFENPPKVTTVFRFLPQTGGVPRGTGANVRLYECSGQFSEWLADYSLQ